MITNALNEVLGDRTKVEILRFLIANPGEYTGRQVWRGIGRFSHATVISALKGLAASGQLKYRSAAPSYLFSLNEKNVFTARLKDLFEAEDQVVEEAGMILKEKLGDALARVLVFGSVAAGDDMPDSDMDLIISVGDGEKSSALRDRVEEAAGEVEELTGMRVDYVLVEESELAGKRRGSMKAMWADVFGEKPVIMLEFKRGEFKRGKAEDGAGAGSGSVRPARRFFQHGREMKL